MQNEDVIVMLKNTRTFFFYTESYKKFIIFIFEQTIM